MKAVSITEITKEEFLEFVRICIDESMRWNLSQIFDKSDKPKKRGRGRPRKSDAKS